MYLQCPFHAGRPIDFISPADEFLSSNALVAGPAVLRLPMRGSNVCNNPQSPPQSQMMLFHTRLEQLWRAEKKIGGHGAADFYVP
jgi:hypothetical protein